MGNGEVGFRNLNPTLQGILSVCGILAIIIPMAISNAAIKDDVEEIKAQQKANIEQMASNLSKIHALEIGSAEQGVRDIQIMKSLDEIKSELKQWEPVNAVRN